MESLKTRNSENDLHSVNDEPALIGYSEHDGTIILKLWYKDGLLHREHGPACVEYWGGHQDRVSCEIWMQYGLKHRLDEYAVLHYYNNEDNNIRKVYRWVYDVHLKNSYSNSVLSRAYSICKDRNTAILEMRSPDSIFTRIARKALFYGNSIWNVKEEQMH
jgi:hypothetical protein